MSLGTFTPWQLHKLQKEHDRNYYYADGYIVERVKIPPQKFAVVSVVPPHCCASRRRTRRTTRSSAKSGDSNADPEPEPERTLLSLNLYDQAALADLLAVSKKTLQNIYSVAPHSLPKAISIPGARGPRWAPQAVQEWLESRPQHTPKPAIPVVGKRKAGRPRIALRSVGGAK